MRATRSTLMIFLGVATLLLIVGRSKMFSDADTYWHIAVGRRIMETARVPVVDEFTYTAEGQPWLSHSWLAECIMALLDRLGGFDALLWFFVLLASGLYAWIACRLMRAGSHWLLAVFGIALVFIASSHNLLARPLVLTVVLLAMLYGWLLEIEAGRRSLRTLGALPLIFLGWANLHPGVLGGVGTLGLTLVGWVLAFWSGLPSPVKTKRDVTFAVAIGLFSLMALVVNPYGLEMFTAWQRNLSMDLPHLVIEHARLDPRRADGFGVVLLAILYGLGLLLTPLKQQRVTWWMPAIWAVLAISRVRHGPLFASLAMLALAELLPLSRLGALLGRRGFWQLGTIQSEGQRIWGAAMIVAPGLLLLLIGLGHLVTPTMSTPALWVRPPAHVWPVDFQDALDGLSTSSDRPIRVLNEQSFAGYLIYRYPSRRVFVDGRCELFGEAFLSKLIAADHAPSIYAQWLKEFPCDAALVNSGSIPDRLLAQDPNWHLLRRSSQTVLYHRGP